MVLSFVHLVLNHSSAYTVFCLHGCFSKVSKNSVSRGPPVFLVSWIKSNLISSRMTLKWDIVQCLLTHSFLLPTKWGGKQNYSGNVKGQEALMVYICSSSGLLVLGFMSNWEENNCCYKLSKFSKWLPFSLKISPSTIWKQFYEFALLVTTVISFSAWDKSHDSTAKSSRLEHM